MSSSSEIYPDLSCECCGRNEFELFVCKQCLSTLYCSSACKNWDLEEGDHKLKCTGFIGLEHNGQQHPSCIGRRASHISPEKAREMLRNPPHHRALTDKQRKLFWWIVRTGGGHHKESTV
jgi:hypothetical protein